ncbi:carboxylesterase family protein [Deinococcus cellulosilyticus]|nr:carboxylesterase family protein [Deinococcus cellulosilyticus]
MFWPNSQDGRTSLRKALSSIHKANLGLEFSSQGEYVEYRASAHCFVDLHQLQIQTANPSSTSLDDVLRLQRGEILEDLVLDDCPDFEEWLIQYRESVHQVITGQLQEKIQQLMAQQWWQPALKYVQHLLQLNPYSEEAHLQKVQLQWRLGDPQGARDSWGRHLELLRELGVKPDQEFEQLVASLQRQRGTPMERALPEVRAEILQTLLSCYHQQRVVLLQAEDRMGKTWVVERLLREIQGAVLVAGQPGDALVPFSTLRRMLAQLVNSSWAQHSQASILAEVRNLDILRGGPFTERGQEMYRLYFYDVVLRLLRHLHQMGLAVLVLDDVQHMDLGSLEVLVYLVSQRIQDARQYPWMMLCHRMQHWPPSLQGIVSGWLQHDQVSQIHLPPLSRHDIQLLFENHNLHLQDHEYRSILRYTRGNPMVVLELIGVWKQKEPQDAPDLKKLLQQIPRVHTLIQGRIQQLETNSRAVLQIAVVAGQDFSLDLAQTLLSLTPAQLTRAVQDLEDAQLLRDGEISYNIYMEAVLESMSAQTQRWWHTQVAEALQHRPVVDPSRIAHHWLQAAAPDRAIPHLLKAAEQAEQHYALRHAADLYEKAAHILKQQHDDSEAFSAFEKVIRIKGLLEDSNGISSMVQRLQSWASTSLEHARVRNVEASFHYRLFQYPLALSRARQAENLLNHLQDTPVRRENLIIQYLCHWRLEQYPEALEVLERLKSLARQQESQHRWEEVLLEQVALLSLLYRNVEALALLDHWEDVVKNQLHRFMAGCFEVSLRKRLHHEALAERTRQILQRLFQSERSIPEESSHLLSSALQLQLSGTNLLNKDVGDMIAEMINALSNLEGIDQFQDLPYGPLDRQVLDVYRPHGKSESPVLLFIHGGSWNTGDKSHYLSLAEKFCQQGHVVVCMNYRLYPEVVFPAFVEDAALAVNWVVQNIHTYGGKPDRLAVMGHGAGADSATLLAFDPRYLQQQHLTRQVIRALVCISGTYDSLYQNIKLVGHPLLLGNLQDSRDVFAAEFVQDQSMPVLLLHGMLSPHIDHGTAHRFAERIREQGGEAWAISYPNQDHYGPLFSMSALGQLLGIQQPFEDVVKFLKQVLQKQEPSPSSTPVYRRRKNDHF